MPFCKSECIWHLSCSVYQRFLLPCHSGYNLKEDYLNGESLIPSLWELVQPSRPWSQAKLKVCPSKFQGSLWDLWSWKWRQMNIFGNRNLTFKGRTPQQGAILPVFQFCYQETPGPQQLWAGSRLWELCYQWLNLKHTQILELLMLSSSWPFCPGAPSLGAGAASWEQGRVANCAGGFRRRIGWTRRTDVPLSWNMRYERNCTLPLKISCPSTW